MACFVDITRTLVGSWFGFEDRYGRTGWMWFLQTVTPQMEVEARRRDHRREQRRVDRRFALLEREMTTLERALPTASERERQRLASQLANRRDEHGALIRQTRFATQVERELTAAIEDRQIMRSAVALARIAERQRRMLTPERARRIVEQYREARRQKLDTYDLFDSMFIDSESESSSNSTSSTGGTPLPVAVESILREFPSPNTPPVVTAAAKTTTPPTVAVDISSPPGIAAANSSSPPPASETDDHDDEELAHLERRFAHLQTDTHKRALVDTAELMLREKKLTVSDDVNHTKIAIPTTPEVAAAAVVVDHVLMNEARRLADEADAHDESIEEALQRRLAALREPSQSRLAEEQPPSPLTIASE